MTPPVSELLSIPVVPGVSAVFVAAEAELAGIWHEGQAAKLIASHRIHGLSQRIIVCLVADAQFRDGSTVTVQLKGRDGEQQYEIPVRLASWRHSTTAKVVRFIASKILPRLKSTDHSPLERFLLLSAGWRETAPTFSTEDSIFALVSVPNDVLAPEMSFYSARRHRVTFGRAETLSIDGSRALIKLPKDAVGKVAYIGADENLIELEIGDEEQGPRDLVQVIGDLPSAAIGKVLDWLEEFGQGAEAFVDGITSGNSSMPSAMDLVQGARLLRSLKTSEKILLFLECDDGVELDQISLRPIFGQQSVPMSLTHRFVSKAPGKRRIVASAPERERCFVYRVSATINGETTSRWIRTERLLRSSDVDFALSFWPANLIDKSCLSAVVLPVLAAEARQFGADSSSGEIRWGGGTAARPRHEVTIISVGDIAALKKSIGSLTATTLSRPAVRIFLTSPARQELVAEALTNLSSECELDLSLDVFPAPRAYLWAKKLRTTASDCVVVLREGAAPARPDWFEAVRAEFDRGDAVLTATIDPRAKGVGARYFGLLTKSAVLARTELDDLRCLTFDGFCRQLTDVFQGKGLRILPTLPFVDTTHDDIDSFAQRLDSILLRQSAKAADRSEAGVAVSRLAVASMPRREKARRRRRVVNR